LLQANLSDIVFKQGQVLHNHAETELTLWDLAQGINWDISVPEDSDATMARATESKIKQSFPPNNLTQRLAGLEFIHDHELPGMLHARVVTPRNYRAKLHNSIDELSALLPPEVSVVHYNSFIAVVSQREELVVAAAKQLHELSVWSADEVSADTKVHSHPLDGLPFNTVIDYKSEGVGIRPISATVSVQIERPCLSHASIGPGCALAHYIENNLTVWSHSQGVFSLRTAIASMLALEPDTVHVIHMPGAGCYGHNSADDVAADAALTAMLKPGVPIRMQYSRADEFQKSPLGPAMRTACKAELNDQNQFSSVQIEITSPMHSSRPGTMKAGGGSNRNALPAYRIPAVEIVVNRMHNLPYRVSSLRGLGAFINVLAIEALMDECAMRKAGSDPIDYRLKHLDDPRARAVIETVAELAGYDGDKTYGIGYGRYKNTAAYCACMARVEVDEQINVKDIWIVADAGENINPDGIAAQLEGGAVQAMSWLLQEEALIAGHATSVSSWEDYPIARFSNMPAFHVKLLEPDAAPALGCGEASQGPAAAAVYNAACRFMDMRPTRLPLSREGLMNQLLSEQQ